MPASDRARELVLAAAHAAADKLATDVVAIDVSEQLVITDAFLVASAPNDRQVGAIVDAVEEALRAQDAKPLRREGERDGPLGAARLRRHRRARPARRGAHLLRARAAVEGLPADRAPRGGSRPEAVGGVSHGRQVAAAAARPDRVERRRALPGPDGHRRWTTSAAARPSARRPTWPGSRRPRSCPRTCAGPGPPRRRWPPRPGLDVVADPGCARSTRGRGRA